MSEYNRRASSNTQGQSIPGTSAQQMWHVLNFHEHRLLQLTQHLQQQSSNSDTDSKSEAQHLVEYNTLLQQVEKLKARVSTLEAEKEKSRYPSNVTLSME
uniref:Uncharacterized protein n=1 Tax=viral metagenome TaxID=1070528 RepID=A0A6C0EME2_9ZZZZ